MQSDARHACFVSDKFAKRTNHYGFRHYYW